MFGWLHFLLPAVWLVSLGELWVRWDTFAQASAWPGLAARITALSAGAAGSALLLRVAARGGVERGFARDLPGLIVCGLFALAAGTAADACAADTFWIGSLFADGLVLALSLWCLVRWRGLPARGGLALTNLGISLLLLEVALAGLTWLRPHPLLASGSDLVQRMESLRLPPGEPYFGTPANSRGYFDEEFEAGGPNSLVVVLLADSFGIGVVPQAYNFSSVAEAELAERLAGRFERVAIHNFAVTGVGMNEYAYLLETEVAEVAPDQVVLAVFVGNDIHRNVPFGARPAHDRRSLLRWRSWAVPQRLWRVATEAPVPGSETGEGGPGAGTGRPPRHIQDPARERPTYSVETFHRLEARSLEVCDADDPEIEAAYAAFLRGLLHFRERLGERLLVLIIPDEFQVNDSLYTALLEERPTLAGLPRDLPQQRITEFCTRQGIACLDLLPALRRAERTRRTYHLRDTHWNAHGNEVAGRALAAALFERVPIGR